MLLTANTIGISEKPPLTEKVLQFGTGVLLRGLCDFFIDKANKKGIFNGSVVIVKSTSGETDEFKNQDNLYTVCVRGLEKGATVEEDHVIQCISRVLSAQQEWEEILRTAENEELKIVISNTTEVGLQYHAESILATPPVSFPGKLTAWLYNRYQKNQVEVVVIPTELIVDNGPVLKDLVLKHVEANGLEAGFTQWLNEKVKFCSSLVDRIVPGKPRGEELTQLYEKLGYEDSLLTIAEAYRLWAIEGDEHVKDILSFYEVDLGVKIEKNIEKYRELKLRLLNAPHTLLCGMAFLSGFETVKDMINDEMMEKYITILMLTELGPSIPLHLETKTTQRYGREVIDRFRNPFLKHHWISITFQYTMKMRMRAIPLLLNYYQVFETVPQYFARCFAAYILFMKSTKGEDGKYYGESNGVSYPVNCDAAAYFSEVWTNHSFNEVVSAVLSNKELWGADLLELKGFAENVETHLCNMVHAGVREVAAALNVYA
ncbi:tagaturonate reductase [Emticicia sp. CRIBPO]|uniref:tagaturonate reductase n=1 Tax=Emticicia sp. CRIBPO TaxID=2683258 RepID=UPI00141242C3|nr:tagaturonate reductase [Emticicia sp. CRIBPO]NBA86475.1 tagaturonate reductase [Emticicia sp. CRIBPO]